MRFKRYLKESKYPLQDLMSDYKIFVKWIDQFPKSGRAPKGMKKEYEKIQFLKKQAEFIQKFPQPELAMQNVNATLSWWTPEDLQRVEDAMLKDTVEEIKSGNLIFKNESAMGEKTFISKAKKIDKFLKTLKGYHKKAISKPLTIIFKPTKLFKAKAKYNEQHDQIWVKQGSKVDNELYGHLLYIIVHELGHRYEKFYGLPSKWKDTYTTDYSKKEGFAASEAFAELFAISHWPNKYKEYSDKIEWFKGIM